MIPAASNIVGRFLSDHPHVNIAKINSKEFKNYKKIFKPNIKNNIKSISERKEEEVALVYQIHNTIAGIQLDYKKDPMRFLRRLFLKIPSNIIRKFLNIFGFFITKLNGLIAKAGLIFEITINILLNFLSQSQEENNKIF